MSSASTACPWVRGATSPRRRTWQARWTNPILGLFGGADAHITPDVLDEFETALGRAGVEHRIVSYPDAPHSFFDRKYEEHAAAAADAWHQVLGFIAANTAAA